MNKNRIFKRKIIASISLCVIMALNIMTDSNQMMKAATVTGLNITSMIMAKNQTQILKLTNNRKKITWKTSNSKIVTVSKKGKVKAKDYGKAKVIAKIEKKEYICNITVANPKKNNKSLVVYFSQTGTTKSVATKIKKITGADILSIKPKVKYTSDYEKLLETAQNEFKKKTLPAQTSKVLNMKQYNKIYIGFPIWYGKAPKIIESFMKNYKFKGKTIVPFCTSGGSDIDGAMKQIKNRAKGAVIKSGYTADEGTNEEIKDWLKEIGIIDNLN